MTTHDHTCHCGVASTSPHIVGTYGCPRRIVDAPLKTTAIGYWMVDGGLITDFTLREQRGYHQHPCGCWSTTGEHSNSVEHSEDAL
jgi:hypothetical protein